MLELKYKALILDVDGTLTDGGLYLDDHGLEAKRFDVTDGSGIKYFHRAGGRVGFLTGRNSRVVESRAAELGVQFVIQGALQKEPGFRQMCEQMGVRAEEAAYMGDDLPDIPAMRLAGYVLAPANAVAEIKALAHFVTHRAGGHGAVREAIEHLLAGEPWRSVVQRYGLGY